MLVKTPSLAKAETGPEGSVKVQFATLNVIDHDNDVTVPGAFTEGEKVRMASYGHKTHELPVGHGIISSDNNRATMSGRFYLNTSTGKEHYEVVKEQSAEGLQEWSYEYDILDAEPGTWNGQPVQILKRLKVHGVTPVYLGAGIGTQTLEIKSFADDGEAIAAQVEAFVNRAKDRASLRAKEGRTLSAANRNRLAALVESLNSVSIEIGKLLEETDPDAGKASKDELRKLFGQFHRTLVAINGV